MAKQKFYVVWEGAKPGIYDSWPACQQQVAGYPNARYKSFDTRALAEEAYKGAAFDFIGKGKKTAPKVSTEKIGNIVRDSICVDAACSGVPGPMEYRGVTYANGDELFHVGPLPDGTNNVGEFLAIVHGLAYLKQQSNNHTAVYSDSRNAIKWVKQKKSATKLERTRRNVKIFEMLDRAEKWLAMNTYQNPILKWETKAWGEIPADFGRK